MKEKQDFEFYLAFFNSMAYYVFMNAKERREILKKSKPDYVVYWHRLNSHTDPHKDGYIGIAKTTGYRFSPCIAVTYKQCIKFFNAIQKYGEENIITEIIKDGLSIDEANALENEMRPSDDIGWNIRQGGGNRGTHSEETKRKISVVKRAMQYPYDKIFTQETRDKIRASKMGNKNMVGKKHSQETLRKMSISAKKRGISENTRLGRLRKVICYETGIVYNSQKEAQEKTGISRKGISSVCTGVSKSIKGTTWGFYNEKRN